jgi:integrase
MRRLSDKLVGAFPTPSKSNRRYPDSDLPGFSAQITAAGRRSFVLRYRIHGRERLYTIGAFPTWTTAAARNRARELRRLIDQGIDPHQQEVQARDEAITLAEFWRRVYEPLHVATKSQNRQANVRSMLRTDILPYLGNRSVAAIDRADATALFRQVNRRAPMRANRVIDLLQHMLNWAEEPQIDATGARVPALRSPGSNPCRKIARNYEERRQRFLAPAEIARLAAVLDQRPERDRLSVALVRLLLLTGARFNEAARATWSQFDLGRGTWVKPSAHTKQKREHTVYLSAPVLALLQDLRAQNESGVLLFPGPTGRPIVTIRAFWRSVTQQAGLTGVRVHDLRHSFASVLASSGASLQLIGALLGHTQIATTQRYAHLVDSVQREAVERAGAVLTGGPVADVVPLRKRR